MFCKNCGAEISEESKFCPHCGADKTGKVESKKAAVEDNKIKHQVKSEYNVPYKLICGIGSAILWVFLIFFCFTDLYELWAIYPVSIAITIGVVVICIMIKMIFEKKQYDDLEYNFYATKVEYKDGFLNKEEKELKYKHIREVTMNQNVLERIFKIGTIRVFTNASSGSYNGRGHNMKGKNGIYIHCVKNVQEQYKIVKELIDEGTPED